MPERIKGIVKWFSNKRGYGFVAPEGGGSDIFAHFSNIQMEGYKTLQKDQVVEFEVGTIDKDGRAMSNALEIIILGEGEAGEDCCDEDTETDTEERW
jgi:CspA family cold shock protein